MSTPTFSISTYAAARRQRSGPAPAQSGPVASRDSGAMGARGAGASFRLEAPSAGAIDASVGGAGVDPVGSVLVRFDRIGSTQDEARTLLAFGAPHGTIVLAELQAAGRGRRGRGWASPGGGGLWCTVILRRGIPEQAPQWITMGASVAVCESARAMGAAGAQIKWPNDIVTARGKLAGVLGELVADPGGRACALLGIGLNVDIDPLAVSSEIGVSVSSLRAEGASSSGLREDVLAVLAERLDGIVGDLAEGRHETILSRWKDLSPTSSGCRVVVEEMAGGESLSGSTRGIEPDGSLRLLCADGSTRLVRFGGTLRFEPTP